MATVDLVMPKMGESIMEATILKWHKQPGDAVKMDETILEIATDKVDSEVPSTAEGVIEEILFNVNDVVPIGKVIARIKTGSSESSHSTEKKPDSTLSSEPKTSETVSKPEKVSYTTSHVQPSASGNGNRFYSPLVLNIAAQEGVSMTELEVIPGTGNEGRVTKRDILQYVSDKRSGRVNQQATTQKDEPQREEQQMIIPMNKVQPSVASTQYSGNVEIIEMDRMRKLIADHMVRSKHTSPHVTSFTEADVTNLVLWRNRVKKEFEKREGAKITFTPLFIEAIVRCIKKFPLINSSVDGDKIIVKKDINIGMATALQSGNLIVPVIRNADQLNLVGLAKQVNNLA
ncbi:MAG TPA: dihydrolipoamide acetyltransferase family protein, partial [Chitinophagaceae bacterium]